MPLSMTEPRYLVYPPKPEHAKNKYILKWWNKELDQLMLRRIETMHWAWSNSIFNDIVDMVGEEVIDKWRERDPICKKYAWYNVITCFAEARALILGYYKLIRKPSWKSCMLCHNKFIESSIGDTLLKRIGYDNFDYCAFCLYQVVFGEDYDKPFNSNKFTKNDIIEYLIKLTKIIGVIPPQDFGKGIGDFFPYNNEERLKIFSILVHKPTLKHVKFHFDSWLEALIASGILENGTRRTARGTHCIAKDGDVCFSLAEKTIDDLLFELHIPHKKEPHYPESNYRADFEVNGTFIEYFGLVGDRAYDVKIKEKKKLCRNHNIALIAIYPKDLLNHNKMRNFFLRSFYLPE